MLEESKFWVILILVGILGSLGYGAHYLASVDEANLALQESKSKLVSVQDQLAFRKKEWAGREQSVAKIQVETDKTATLLKAQDILETRYRKVESDLKYLLESMKTSVAQARESAVGSELGEITLASGKVLRGVKMRKVEGAGISMIHADGIGTIAVEQLPENLKEKYDLGPNALISVIQQAQTSFLTKPASNNAAPTEPVLDKPATQPVRGAAAPSFDPALLVFIKTASNEGTGSGSGFIAKSNGKTYVYTNAHVLCGEIGSFTTKITSIKTASGRVIPTPYELELSEVTDTTSESGLEDLARFPITMKEGESAYEISALDSNTAMNGRVIAYGNSLGGEVITSLNGTILGLGTDRMEISCAIVPGNSGGPVLLEQTKKVIGISTYLTNGRGDIWARGTKFDQVRRFALRPEKVTKWRRMLYTSLMSSTVELNAFHRDTLSLAAACYLNPKPNNAGFDVSVQSKGDYELRKVLVEGSKHSLGQTITAGMARVNQRLGGGFGGGKTLMSVQGVVPYFAEFFNTVAQASSSQMQSMQNADRAPYLKQFIPELVRIRSEIHAIFLRQAERFR
jgi:hypothetical protein